MTALEAFGYAISTVGPVGLAVGFWRLAGRVRANWLVHLLFVPLAITVYKAGEQLVFFAAGVPDGDSVEGYILLPALCLLVLTTTCYLAALASRALATMGRQREVR